MGLFSWSDKYLLSCAAIDDEHRVLFRLAANLHDALAAGKGTDVLKGLLGELATYTQTHFRHEESLMRESAYPGYREHKAQHDELTAKVAQLQKQGETGKLAVTLETMRFLREWLDTHICKTDRAVADHVRSHGRQPVRV